MIDIFDDTEQEVGGLVAFITTNVATARPVTREDLEDSFERLCPTLWTLQFEVGPEDMFPRAV